jgi:hypothetical protein
MKKLLCLVLIAFTSIAFAAGFKDGNKLYEQLNKDDLSSLVAQGYILGVMDSQFNKCYLENVQGSQIFDAVNAYLQNHPESRQYIASYLVEKAVKEKFKCK